MNNLPKKRLLRLVNLEQIYKIFKQCNGVSTDSRKLPEACLFVALKGERFDGNEYALDALEKGAAYALVSDHNLLKNDHLILVKDTLQTLQDLARHHRRQFDIPFLAITGSNGKTTTKELVSSVLSAKYKTHFTQGNFNNHIGVPLTLLAIPDDTEMAVIEMGANHRGEIDFLCRIAEPTHGLITNVGKAHLEGFGGFEGVKQTKSELYRYLNETKGTVFVNKNEDHLWDLLPPQTEFIAYATGDNIDFKLNPESADPFINVILEEEQKKYFIETKLIGAYNFNNILTAVTIGNYFNIENDLIKTALEAYTPTNNRSQFLQKNKNDYILDAYNANPTSMRIALENFDEIDTDLPKIAILGDMLELGDESSTEHQKIVDLAAELNYEQTLLVGNEFSKIKLPSNMTHFPDVIALKTWFDAQHFSGMYFLIKGSRGIRLEQLLT